MFLCAGAGGGRGEACVEPLPPLPCAVSQRPFPTWTHRPSAVFCDTPSAKVGAFSVISSPTFRVCRPCTASCGIPPPKVGVFLALFTPTFWKHRPCTTFYGILSSKVGVFLALFIPTCWMHRPCTTFYGIPPPKVGVFMAIFSPTFWGRRPCTAPCGIPPLKVGVFLAIFTPTFRNAESLRHSLSAFKSSHADHQAGLPYTTVPFSVRNGLASASRTERGWFSVPRGLQRHAVQQKGVFCTEGDPGTG